MKEQWKKQMQEKMADYQESDIEVSWAEIEKLLANNRQQAKVVPMRIRCVAAAAVILLIAGGGYWTLFRHQTGTEADETSITNTIQTPNTPDSIVNPVKPIIEEMVARVTQGVRRPKTVSDTTDVTPLVAEDADTLATVFAETESDHGDGSDDPISEGNGITQNRPHDPLTLRGTTNESVTLQISHLLYIEAVGNYVKVSHLCDNQVHADMLRATMKQMEETLQNYPMIVRCHRAFLVNLSQVEQIVSHSGSTQLIVKHCHESLPVSRSNMSTIKEALKLN